MSAPNISSDLESVVVETSSPRGSHGDLPLPSVPECPEEKEDDEPNDKGIEVIINCPSSAPTDEEDNSVSTDHEEAVRQRANTFIKIDYNEVDGITRFKNAALYLHEGENNDKFFHHPQTWWSYLAFHVVHNEVYQYTQMAISLLLMGLAIIEPPTYIDGIPPWVHSGLEMVFLLFFATDTILQLVWLQPRAFITHKRTVLKIFIILIEYIEAFVVAVRGDVHIRVLRCLRPFFFVDSFVTSGVRRVLRQMLSSLGPIIDILLLYILAVALFSLIAFLLFGSYDNIFFINFRETFVNMFIAQTSANFPDVMMQVYLEVPYAPIFFILYIVVQFYIISNMLLGLVYSSFQGQHLKKFRKLYFHKKESVKRVFHELQRKNVLHFADFYLLMKAYLPNASKIRVLCMFKALDTTHSNTITLSEFYKFYDILDLTWDRIDTEEGKSIVWHGRLPKPVHSILQVMRKIIEWPFFDLIVNVIIVANGLFLWIYTSSIELTEDNPKALDAVQKNTLIFYVSLAFTIVYAVELVIKIVVLGPAQFFLKAWNAFDFLLVVISIFGHVTEASIASAFIFLRPLRLLRLLRLKRRYRDMMNTLIVLLPQLLNIVLVLLVLYYFYAIWAMEFFSGTVSPNCCESDGQSYSVKEYYQTGNSSVHYYLNNFDNIFRSFVTLFELMFVNNWHVLMEGFRLAYGGDFSVRIYFITFSLCTEVILTIIIAYIIDTFVVQYRVSEKLRDELKKRWESMTAASFFCKPHQTVDELSCRVVNVELQQKHIDGLERINAITVVDRIAYQLHKKSCDEHSGILKFRGRRRKNKDDINQVLYQENIQQWENEFERGIDNIDSNTGAGEGRTRANKVVKWLRNLLDYWLL